MVIFSYNSKLLHSQLSQFNIATQMFGLHECKGVQKTANTSYIMGVVIT